MTKICSICRKKGTSSYFLSNDADHAYRNKHIEEMYLQKHACHAEKFAI